MKKPSKQDHCHQDDWIGLMLKNISENYIYFDILDLQPGDPAMCG